VLQLSEFVYRLAFGLAAAMCATPVRWVPWGYFQVHTWVLLGLQALAAAVAWLRPDELPLWLPAAAAGCAYGGSLAWGYRSSRAGTAALVIVAALSLAGAYLAQPAAASGTTPRLLAALDPLTSGLLLGTTIAAMFLGHYYLNAPGMQLVPLRRLVLGMAAAAILRGLQAAAGLWLLAMAGRSPEPGIWLFLALRYLAGVLGVLVAAWMTWQTLKIPNTQSATGILYVGVILVFVGELVALLLRQQVGWAV
jgi:hypothetical protein